MAEVQNSAYPPVDATAALELSKSRTEAYIRLFPPQYGGAALNLQQLTAFVEQKGVTYGIDKRRLQSLALQPIYGEAILIASGVDSVSGTDAALTYYITLEKDLRPKERPDGSVDFRDLGLIEYVTKGMLLCEKKPATQGTAGTDVMGNPIPSKPGKDKTLPAGKNTVLSEDKLKLFAGIDGQADFINNKINVLDTFTVDGDVSTATGDINFAGNVVINGGVASGYSVQAGGNVDINGIVESARVIAGGNIIIRNGFNAGETGELNSGANITCRYIQGGRVVLSGNLETTYILNSNVMSGGSINVSGKGLVVGGRVTAFSSITASLLGSANTTASTEIVVGSDPILVKRSHEIPKEMEECAKNLRSITVLVQTFMQLKEAGRLTPDKLAQMEKTLNSYSHLKQLQVDLSDESAAIQEKLAAMGHGFVRVLKTAYPGVKIIIGSEQFPLRTEYTFTCFKRTAEGITCAPAR